MNDGTCATMNHRTTTGVTEWTMDCRNEGAKEGISEGQCVWCLLFHPQSSQEHPPTAHTVWIPSSQPSCSQAACQPKHHASTRTPCVIPSPEPSSAPTYLGGPRDVTHIDEHIDDERLIPNQMNERTHKWMINRINSMYKWMHKWMHNQWTNK